jgi:hypothetical protein
MFCPLAIRACRSTHGLDFTDLIVTLNEHYISCGVPRAVSDLQRGHGFVDPDGVGYAPQEAGDKNGGSNRDV